MPCRSGAWLLCFADGDLFGCGEFSSARSFHFKQYIACVRRRKVWNVLLWEAALHASAVAISVDDAALPSWRRAGRVPPRTSFLGSFCVFANFVGLLPSAYGITRTLIEATILIWPTRTLDGKIGSMSRGRMASPCESVFLVSDLFWRISFCNEPSFILFTFTSLCHWFAFKTVRLSGCSPTKGKTIVSDKASRVIPQNSVRLRIS